jgi:Lrp/AsnC family leucine-responsive transcriptional regulator
MDSSVKDGQNHISVKKNGRQTVEREVDKLLDDVGWQILSELQADARVPFAELGRRVGLSTPAVIERVRRLEEAGVITGYHAAIDPSRIGLGVFALVRVSVASGVDTSRRLGRVLLDCPEVLEAHHVTGDDCYVCKVRVASVGHLERLIEQLGHYGNTTTSIVLSSPVARRAFDRPT